MGIASKKIDSKGLKVKAGVIQYATFITADPGYLLVTTPLRTKIKKKSVFMFS